MTMIPALILLLAVAVIVLALAVIVHVARLADERDEARAALARSERLTDDLADEIVRKTMTHSERTAP